jgi:hypothetical protein
MHARWKSPALSGKRERACVSKLHLRRSVPVVGYIHVCLEMLLYRDVCPAFLSAFVCVRARLCALVHALCVHPCVCACALGGRAHISVGMHFRGCVCSMCVRARLAAVLALSLHDGRPETRGRTHVIWRLSSAAGVTWTSRTTNAPWDARFGHTSVIDAAGAICVIGGHSGSVFLRDKWVSTDGGADRTRGGCFRGYYG